MFIYEGDQVKVKVTGAKKSDSASRMANDASMMAPSSEYECK